MPDSPEHVPVIAAASGKGAVPEQVAAGQLIAGQVRGRLADLRGPAESGDGAETDVV